MDKIESVEVDQSILGRILDYGEVTIRGTGAGVGSLGTLDAPIAAPLDCAITSRASESTRRLRGRSSAGMP